MTLDKKKSNKTLQSSWSNNLGERRHENRQTYILTYTEEYYPYCGQPVKNIFHDCEAWYTINN